jgi:hypothetical protein
VARTPPPCPRNHSRSDPPPHLRERWYFRSKPTDIIRGYVEDEPSAPLWAMQKQLAEHFETDFTANEKNMKPLFRAYQLANLALAGEVIVWIIILIER